jgi:multiple sugar transport system substrate-binding protein
VKLVTTYWGGGAKVTAFENCAADYKKQYPNVDIELIAIPGPYNSKVLGMIAAGDPPDVLNINSDLTIALEGQLLDLTERMEDLGYFDKKDGLWESWFNLLASDGYYERGEPLYQAPLGTGSDVLAYNKDMFDAAGVAYPTEDWTWEKDFLEAAKKLTRDGKYGITALIWRGNAMLIPLAKSFGGDVYDMKNLQFVGDNPKTVAAYQFAQDLIYKHRVHPTPAQEEALGGATGGVFQAENAAMTFLPTFQFPAYYNSKFRWDIMQLPKGPTRKSWASFYGGRLAVMKTTENPGHAFGFINLINGPIGQGHFSISSGFNNPPLKGIAYSDAFMKGPAGAPEHNFYRVTALENSVDTFPVLPNGGKISASWGNKMDLFWQNEIDAAQLMKELEAEIQPLLDDR